MTWHLTVTSGADESQRLSITEGDCQIGRSPACGFHLRDESVAWEHARVRVEDGKLFLQNLSSLGTHVKGRRITDEVPVGDNDEIMLSESCRIVVSSRLGSSASKSSLPLVLLLLVVLIAAGGAGVFLMDDPPAPPPRVTIQHWTQAYQRIEKRLEEWTRDNRMPIEVLDLYRAGWRLEKANNNAGALERWKLLRSSLLTLPLPFRGRNAPTFAEEAGASTKSLSLVMGVTSGDEAFDWNSDEVIADAFVWFVRKRAERAQRKTEESS